jgi:hypothetical protein
MISAALAAASLAVAGAAWAQGTAEERSACMGDALQFCSADVPNVSQIEACLKANRERLTPACQAEFKSAGRTRMHATHFR